LARGDCDNRHEPHRYSRGVVFAEADPTLNDRIDAAYRAKYRRHGARWVDPMVAREDAREDVMIELLDRQQSLTINQ
jgi:hypothetical protein